MQMRIQVKGARFYGGSRGILLGLLESAIPGFSSHPDRHFPYLDLGIFFYSKTIYLSQKI